MTIYLVVFLAGLNHIGFSGSRVAVSLYALELGADQITIGALISLYSLCPMLLSILIGRFADRVPPRLPMIVGTLGIGLALILPPLFPGIAVLYVSSFIMGLSNQLFTIPLEAMVGGIGGVEKRVHNYAALSIGWSVAAFFGPLIAGFSIDYIGHLQVFLVLAAVTVVPVVILCLRPLLLTKVAAARAGNARHGSVLELWRMPSLRAAFIAAGIISAAWDLFHFFLPIYGHSLGLSASAIGTILGVFSIATLVIRCVIPLIIKWLTETEILSYSIFMAAFAFVLLPFFVNPYALAAIAFLLGLGVGCANPMSLSLLYVLTPPGRIAESTGLRKTVNHGTHLLLPLVFGSVSVAFGFTTVFLSTSVITAIGGYLLRQANIQNGDLPSK